MFGSQASIKWLQLNVAWMLAVYVYTYQSWDHYRGPSIIIIVIIEG